MDSDQKVLWMDYWLLAIGYWRWLCTVDDGYTVPVDDQPVLLVQAQSLIKICSAFLD